PFWVQREQVGILRHLVPSNAPPVLADDVSAQLIAAGVLVKPSDLENRRRSFDLLIESANNHFSEERFCELPQLIHSAHVTALCRYYESLIAGGNWKLGDEQVTLRHGWHNEMVARYFHHQLTEIVSRVAGERVRPSYTYVSGYRPGAVLRPHVDRRQC